MDTAPVMKRFAEASPRARARITGVVYLLYFLTAIFADFLVSRGFVAYGNAGNLIANGFYIAVTLLFYEMFRPVNRGLSLLAAFFSIVGCAIASLGLFNLVPSSISPLLFFGPYCLLIGYLIFRSALLPRILGVLMMFAGLGWLLYLLPPLAKYLSTYFMVLGILAEGSLMLWLLVMGVNVRAPNQQAGASGRKRTEAEAEAEA